MTNGGVERLTERQRDCLRALLRLHLIKAMAYELGLSNETVRQHLKTARQLLGVSTSLEAAQILAAHDTGHPPKEVTPLEPLVVSAEILPSRDTADEAANATTALERPSRSFLSLFFPPLDRPPNDLSLTERTMMVALMMIALIIALGASAFLTIYVSHELVELSRHGG